MAPPAAAPKRAGTTVLPTKERGMFARLIQEYETKKYKTGLKTADAILKKYPEHGETLSMKGLILASLERRSEGLEMAKQGLRCDLNSFISWHALGILNRIAKNYGESLKCYAQAMRIEGGTNVNLVRESAYLYMQLRDWPKLIEHRTTLLRMQPHLRMYWAGLAVALHLSGSCNEAVRVLEQYQNVSRDVPKRSYEQSEMLLYQAMVLHEGGRHQEAIDFLQSDRKAQIVDVKGIQVLLGQCQLALGRLDDAQQTFAKLLDQNSEDRGHISGWLQAKGVPAIASSAEDREKAGAAFEELSRSHPTSRAIQRLSLVYASGQDFREKATKYIRIAIEKGIPSIFNDVKTLYGDDEKRRTVEDIVEEARREWTSDEASPTSLLWSLYFLAQHYSHFGHVERALAYIESAIAHSPSLPELHTTRARILKRAGSIAWASQAMEDARQLDGQDRSLNCKAVKYLLRKGDITQAMAKAGLFTKPDAPSPVADLVEMQATWYLIEEARAWRRNDNHAMALKRCNQIDKIYTEIWDDQLDFHSYCTRKFTMRAYVNMIRFEDRLYEHPAYFAAATDAVMMYIELHDRPSLYKPETNGKANGDLTDEQRKELKKQQKKANAKAAEEARKAKAAEASKQDKKSDEGEEPSPPKDEDPDGVEALHATDPLVDAERFLTVLKQYAPGHIETWLLAFQVAVRGNNWLQATKYIAQAHKIDPENADVFSGLIKLRAALPALGDAPEPVGKSIAAVLEPLVPLGESGGLESYRAGFVQRNSHRGEAFLANARVALILGADSDAAKVEAQAILTELAKQGAEAQVAREQGNETRFQCSLQTMIEGVRLFGDVGGNVAPFRVQCHVAFPRADAFKSSSEMEKEDEARRAEVEAWATAKVDGEAAPASS